MVLYKTYTANGLYIENGPLLDDDSEFAIQELNCSNDKYVYPNDKLYTSLRIYKLQALYNKGAVKKSKKEKTAVTQKNA